MQVGHLRSSAAPASSQLRPCRDSCACWNRTVAGVTCGKRILWLADQFEANLGREATEAFRSAAWAVLREAPDTCRCPWLHNEYKKQEGVGAWGGWCTCPNGHRYNVGDRKDDCGSLACYGGTAGACERTVNASRAGKQAICANHYERVDHGVGGWGGWCACPDGQRYQVGDNDDMCASLACVGGTPGPCERTVNASRTGRKVTCAAAFGAAPTPTPTPSPPPPPRESAAAPFVGARPTAEQPSTTTPSPERPTPGTTPALDSTLRAGRRRRSFGEVVAGRRRRRPEWSYQDSPVWSFNPQATVSGWELPFADDWDK